MSNLFYLLLSNSIISMGAPLCSIMATLIPGVWEIGYSKRAGCEPGYKDTSIPRMQLIPEIHDPVCSLP